MFPNLDAEMAREKIGEREIAAVIDVDRRTAWNKLNGHTRLYYDEAMAIKDNLFPAVPLEYLFSKTAKEFPGYHDDGVTAEDPMEEPTEEKESPGYSDAGEDRRSQENRRK